MVDAAIVMIENAHKHLERLAPGAPRLEAIIAACKEVGPALFFSLLIITVSFLPVFTLEAQEGAVQPLAYTKTFAMAARCVVTLVPVLMWLFIRGRIPPEHSNPIVRVLIWFYRPVIGWALLAQAHDSHCGDRARGDRVSGHAPGQRVHADPERRARCSTCRRRCRRCR